MSRRLFRISRLLIVLAIFIFSTVANVANPRFFNDQAWAQSEVTATKFNIVGVPYVMSDYENCNPQTLKTTAGQDCWQNWSISLPANRSDYYFGSFGSHYGILWNDTHLGPNQYDWSQLDAYLASAAQMPLRLADGTTLDYKPVIIVASDFLQTGSNPHDGQKDFVSYAPEFVRQSIGSANFELSLAGCDTQDQPPYHLQSFQNYYRQWIMAFGEHIRQSPHAYVIQAVLLGGGLSDEAHPTKSLGDCQYRNLYSSQHQAGYDQFYLSLQDWMKQALTPAGGSRPIKPILAQLAAASPTERVMYARAAWGKGIGVKMNSLAPSNANSIKTTLYENAGGRGALHDYPAMTNILSQPRAFEPVYFGSGPTDERCSSQYCFSDARYQYTYWNYLNALSLNSDFVDFQKEFFNRMQQMKTQFSMDWLSGLLEQSFGKAPNQTNTVWVAFADKFNDYDSYPNPRPPIPELPGSGNYLPAEFTERGDRDFYMYRLGSYEDSSLIRAQGGMLLNNQENYALRTNGCFRNDTELPNQAKKILTGQELRSSGLLNSTHFAHPFSTTALKTEGASGRKYVSLVVEPAAIRIMESQVQVSVWYLDAGLDTFSLEYKNYQGTTRKLTHQKNNTKLWKEASWTVAASDISFSKSLAGGADLRIDCDCSSDAGDEILHMVRLTALNSGQPPTTPIANLQFCGAEGGGGGGCANSSADLNSDGQVNLIDFSIFAGQFLQTGTNRADLNCDGVVDLRDFSLFTQQFSV